MSKIDFSEDNFKCKDNHELFENDIQSKIQNLKNDVKNNIKDFIINLNELEFRKTLISKYIEEFNDELSKLEEWTKTAQNSKVNSEQEISKLNNDIKALEDSEKYHTSGKTVVEMSENDKKTVFLTKWTSLGVLVAGYFVNAHQIYTDIESNRFYAYALPLLLFLGLGWVVKYLLDDISRKPKLFALVWYGIGILAIVCALIFLILLSFDPKGKQEDFFITVRIIAAFIMEVSIASFIYGMGAKIKQENTRKDGKVKSDEANLFESDLEKKKSQIVASEDLIQRAKILTDTIYDSWIGFENESVVVFKNKKSELLT
jgi:hypothetical protein